MQVSNILFVNTNGKVQSPQPVGVVVGYVGGSVVADQTARNPVHVPSPLDLNVTVRVLVLLIYFPSLQLDQ